MRLSPRFSLAAGLLLTLLATGCVTQNKYQRLADEQQQTRARLETCDTLLAQTQAQLKQRVQSLNVSNEAVRDLQGDTAEAWGAYRRQVSLYNQLNATYEQLVENNRRLLSNSASENNKLNSQLSEREQALLRSEGDLQTTRREIDSLRTDLRRREKRVEELESVLAEQRASADALRQRVTNALLNFTSSDLTVDIRDGKVYVSVSEKLLFKSGSFTVDSRGAQALRNLAPILKEQSDVGIMIEGHTDNVPIKTAAIRSNWDLSALRAASIVVLLQEAGVDGARLVAAGRSEYVPVAPNTSADNRARNRRTEIILTPKLDDLFNILGN